MTKNRGGLEAAIGYAFKDKRLLEVALTHPSLSGEQQAEHNQRLEFLGDSVVQLIISERLYRDYPALMEGPLSRLRARSVQEGALCGAARSLHLGSYLRMAHGEELSGGRDRPSVLADAVEALAGAVYLDGGLDAARALVDRFLPTAPAQVARDHKTDLQELLQKDGSNAPVYHIVSEDGPPHKRRFTAEVVWQGRRIGKGSGTSKKSAEQEAAKAAIASMKHTQ